MRTIQTQQQERAPRVGPRPRRLRRCRAQSLIVAVIVLFVLLFIGGVFVGLVARNLLNAGRARATVSAYQFAEAGIQYASEFLENSPEGADWRPSPTPLQDARDPDRRWLETGQFTRVPLHGGRVLIRVSMRPDPRDPLGKYIQIESVGRSGDVNPNDPTTFLSSPAPRLNRRLVAYKAIGLTDFLWYVTNRDNDTKFEAALGVPPIGVPVWMQLGGLPVRTLGTVPGALPPYLQNPTGAPIFVNGSLRLMNNLVLAVDPRYNESVMVAGDLLVEPPSASSIGAQARFQDLASTAPATEPTTLPPILGTTDPQYSTFGGLLRDGSPAPDTSPSSSGHARSISRLEPPSLDTEDPATGVMRYRSSTRDSGLVIRRARDGRWVNTGRVGLGAGLYLNNRASVERETTAVAGGQSLRSIWLRPGSTPNWHGPYYIPPAAFVELGYPVVQARDANGAPLAGQYARLPGFRVVRDASDQPFTDPNGRIATREQSFTFFIYKPNGQRPVLKLENAFFRDFLKDDQGMTDEAINRFLPAFNGLIFAEGNVRVRGLMPGLANVPIRREAGDADNLGDEVVRATVNPPAMTIVSEANIYVDGSIVRESPGSMIALLADDYVVVNTTMFVAPNKALPPVPDALTPPGYFDITPEEAAQTPPFTLDFLFGDDPNGYTPLQGQMTVNLLLRQGKPADGDVTYMNLLVNEALPPAQPGDAFYRFNVPGVPEWVYPITTAQVGPAGFEQGALPLLPVSGAYNLLTAPGLRNTLRPQVDTVYTQGSGTQDYLFSRAAIAPMDVRIEAVMYAQNGSFFIIPGYPMNTDPSDTQDAAVRRHAAVGATQGTMVRPTGTGDIFPFYAQPIDCRITVVGAISENRTASIADQAAWMQLWGYIPVTYGSTGQSPRSTTAIQAPREHAWVGEVGLNPADYRSDMERDAGITRGLRFLYDPALHAPYAGYNPDGGSVLNGAGWRHVVAGSFRQDDFGRILPPVPRLPVCPGFVYRGEDR